jgi:P27 family predicted phage terminase small subunit
MSRQPIEWSPSPRFRKTRAVEKPSTATEGRPSCPRSLSPEARKTFRQLCKQLESRRVLSKGDGLMLALAATTCERQRKAMEDVATRGEIIIVVSTGKDGQPIEREKKNPWLLIAQESEKALAGYLQSLGLTPAARERVKPVKKEETNIPFEPGSIGWILEQRKLEGEGKENAN